MTNNSSSDDLRSLWQSQPSKFSPMSVEELRQASHKLARRVFWRNLREYFAAAIVIVAFSYYFYEFHTVLLRLGSGLTIAGVLFMAFQLFKKGSPMTGAEAIETRNCLDFYRAELVKQRDLLLSVWKWYLLPLVPGLVLFFAGEFQLAFMQQTLQASRTRIDLWLGMVCAAGAGIFLLVAKLNYWAARKLQAKIDALDGASSPHRAKT